MHGQSFYSPLIANDTNYKGRKMILKQNTCEIIDTNYDTPLVL